MEGITLNILTIIFAAGAAWGGTRAGLNGTREAVKEIKSDVKDIRASVSNHGERIARLEG